MPETGIEPVRLFKRRGIFLPLRLSPPAQRVFTLGCWWSGVRLHHRTNFLSKLAALGARRLLSTPSAAILKKTLRSLARRWLEKQMPFRAFTEFDGFTSKVSP